ncbi:hypothetical protein [Nostoc sp.]
MLPLPNSLCILRSHLATFADDWHSPEMSIYDNYDAAKTNL